MENLERSERRPYSTEGLSVCMFIAKTAFERAKEQGMGGTIVITYNLEGSGEDHVAFIPIFTPEELENNPFKIIDSSPKGKLAALKFKNLDEYRQYKKAEKVTTIGIGPDQDFIIRMVETTIDDILAREKSNTLEV